MQKLFNKIIAVILVTLLLGCNSITTCVCAAELIEQNINTSQENVTFNASIGNENTHGYEYKANIDSNDTALYLDIDVKNTGYLKDITVTLEGNNYKLDTNKKSDEIKNINESSIELNQINSGESIKISLPIYLENGEKVSQDVLSKESKIKLKATYVNENNKEKKIEKELKNHLTWVTDGNSLSGSTNQKVIRYLNYNGKTMISMLLSDVLNEYKLPLNSKEIAVMAPIVKETKPSKVIVTAIDTANTNGKLDGTKFDNNNFSYNEETGITTIKINNEPDEQGKISWNKGLEDKFIITYIYDINTNEQAMKINSGAISKMTLANGVVITSEQGEREFDLDKKIGDIATVEINSNTQTLNKGYMYSNKSKTDNKLETEFTENYKLHIGLAEALNKVTLEEVGIYLGEEDASEYIYNKKVSVSKEELVKILGEDGKIDVIKDGKVLGTLNKDTLELEVKNYKLTFETSKPQTEGDITLTLNKAMKDVNYSKEQIKTFETLTSKVKINQTAENVIKLEEPISKAKIEINNTNLSTIVKNEDVIITATLERNDITDNLYKNPEIYVRLPEEVKQIDIKDAKLLYEEELKSESSVIEGNVIKLKFSGMQTEYSKQSTADGSVIRIVADLTLDNLASNKESEVVLGYKNENDYPAEFNTQSAKVNIVAPTGFVTTNTISGYDGESTVTSQEGTEKTAKIPVLSSEKEVTISGTIVNNLGQDATGINILGRIPFAGNKQVDGSSDLGSTFNTTLSSGITTEGLDAKAYYSNNGEATADLSNEQNGWSEQYSNDTKSYLIVANNSVTNTSSAKFNYKVNVPENIQYSNMAKSTYGVYYNNDAQEGTNKNVVLSTPVGMKTDDIPEMDMNIALRDMFTGKEIQNEGAVKEGQYLTYDIKMKNTSKEDAVNSKLAVELPVGMQIVQIEQDDPSEYKRYDTISGNSYNEDLGTIKSQETKTVSLKLLVSDSVATGELNKVLRVTVKAGNMPTDAVSVHNSKLEKGYINGILKSTYEDSTVYDEQEITYALEINNANNEEKTNISAKIKLPKGIEYLSTTKDEYSVGSDIKYEGKYNKQSNEVTFNIDKIAGNDWETVYIKARVTESANGELKTSAEIKCEETEETFYTNQTTLYCGKPQVQAKISSNIDGNLLDTDTLEYYIDVSNVGSVPATVSILDEIPAELANKSYKVEVAGETTVNKTDYKTSSIYETIELKKGERARITIVTEPHVMPSNKTSEPTNKPTIKLLDQETLEPIQELEVNSITHKIQGTGNEESSNGLYRISGTAWLDNNKNGKKDEDEAKLENIKVTLYKNTGEIAKDANGNELVSKTDKDGKYSFINLNSGSYLVVAEYDTNNYVVTTYKAEGLSDSENSDFFGAKLGDLNVAATDTITITNANSYNIDLGLREKEKFDLRLDKMVSKVTVTNTKLEPRVYEFNKKFVQVSLLNTYVELSTVLIEYDISVTNDGRVAGYAKELVDYIPEGMAFSSDLNSNWYLGKDGNAYTTSLANTIINPGETKTVKLVLTRKMTGENVGMVHNLAEISKDYNEYGLQDGNSVPGNKQDGENDMAYADTLLAMSTGKEVISFIGITIAVLAVVIGAVYLIKKYIIVKL